MKLSTFVLTAICTGVLTACGGGESMSPVAISATPKLAATTTAATVSTPAAYTVSNITSMGNFRYADNRILNEKGQVTGGQYVLANGRYRAYLYDNGTTQYLDGLSSGNTFGVAINSTGQVAGYAHTVLFGQSSYRAFMHDGTTMKDLGALTFTLPERAFGDLINDNGQVAGISYNGFNNRAFLHNGTTMKDLGALGGRDADFSLARGMNANGLVVGDSFTGFTNHAFAYDGTTIKDLGTLGPGMYDFSVAMAVNAGGKIVGYSYNGIAHHAFLHDGTMKDLGVLGAGQSDWSHALAISASGYVIGEASAGRGSHAFLYDGATMKDLGSLNSSGSGPDTSYPRAVNNNGQAVGYSYDSAGKMRAFIRSPGDSQMIDLTSRLTNAPGVELYEALAISDSGYIVATANTGHVLLKPAVIGPPPTAPTISPIIANDPVPVGSPVNVSVQFADVNVSDTHTANWLWDTNGITPASITEPNGTTPGTITGTTTFTAAGVYNVTVNVTDSGGKSSQVSRQVVAYDPSAGFVTGGGWMMSPAGAYKADTALSGRANFGFVSKYQKGATKPSGETEFQFQSANLYFQSSNYEWLVVGGARAQYKGTGTINGAGSYNFLLTAVDGDLIAKGTPDRFRMKIWHYDDVAKADVVDYDNQISTTVEGSNLEGTALGGGSISIKSK